MMSALVKINDESARGETTNSLHLNLISERLSVRELIQRRVQQEVEKFNLQRPICFKALVQPEGAQELENGFRLPEHRSLDWNVQAEEAINAFERKSFFVMVDGKELKSLDEQIVLTDKSLVSFIKLMPVIAG
ncbi:MAG: hypothetical protein OEZ58_10975 [Gammaproteobacteria bacterium]|nr:hypothetical protein [Gammaproteobacteria bacterium]MDH5729505.1 hypothetical protein [Gammaproteobacteria bacterium]